MPNLRLVSVAECGSFERKIEKISPSVTLFEVEPRGAYPGSFSYYVTNFEKIAPVEITCDQRGMVSSCTFMVEQKVPKASAEVAAMYGRTGNPGHPIVSLQEWSPSNGEPKSVNSHVCATPYIFKSSLLVCFGEERRAPEQWLEVSSDLHMGFDKSGQLTCIRFPGLTTWQILRLRWFGHL